jgi:uncharacterized protein (DUF302 family)
MEMNFKKVVYGTIDENILKLTEALESQGFSLLFRLNFHEKIKEKTGKEIAPAVILGVCIPSLAYEAFIINPGSLNFMPCHAVVREMSSGVFSIELTRPLFFIKTLTDEKLMRIGEEADRKLERVINLLDGSEFQSNPLKERESFSGHT